MPIEDVPSEIRTADLFNHIDMGFLNRRLCLRALPPDFREIYHDRLRPGEDHMTVLSNDHLLVTILLDVYTEFKAPALSEAIRFGKPQCVFMSTEKLEACPSIYDQKRVSHEVFFELPAQKKVKISYHTEHLVSSTGTMTLSEGHEKGYRQSMVGVLYDRNEFWEIEPLVIGAPWLDHPRNGNSEALTRMMWSGNQYGEIIPEDIAQFSKMSNVSASNRDEWLDAMKETSEADVKDAFSSLLNEPTKKDWGGEENDHFSSNVVVGGRRQTAAFLLKGPSRFSEMTIAMCGKNGDQIYRLAKSGADISVVQHSHLIGAAVRETLRGLIVTPGHRSRKFCIIDGQATYRILKAYNFV